MIDRLGQEVKVGDTVVFVGVGKYKNLKVGILLKVTPKGNATVAYEQYQKDTLIENSRYYFAKIKDGELPPITQQKLKQIRNHYGYTRD